jgi:uncharacterized protein (DUF885 family)
MSNPGLVRACAFAFAASSILAGTVAAQTPSAAFNAQVKTFVDEYLALEPIYADSLGYPRFDDRLPDLTPAGHAKELAMLRAWRSRLIDGATPGDSLDVVADRRELIDTIDGQLFEDQTLDPFANDPQTYVEPLGDGVFLLMIRDSERPDVRFENIAKRLEHVPVLVNSAETNLAHPTKVATELAIDQTRGLLDMYTKDLPEAAKAASAPVQADVDRALPAAVDALKRFLAFLEGPLLARSNRSPRVGAEVFDKLLVLDTGTDEKRETLVAKARANIASTRREMLRLAEPLDRDMFPGKVHAETGDARINAIVGEVFDKLGEQHPAPEAFVASARAYAEKITAFLERGTLVTLPTPGTLSVRETPPFQAGFSGASFQGPGPFALLAPSFYNVDPISKNAPAASVDSYLREYNDYGLQILTIHEALPGHYVQFRYGAQNPSLVRNVFGNGAYVEGWAVFAEGMMLDNGYGGGDPKLRLYQMRWRLREYTNAILDAEYHAGALEKPEAMHLMMDQAFQTKSEAEGKWRRLQLSHDQLSTYFAGLEAFTEARENANLTVAEFNRRVLEMGAVEPRFIQPLLKNKDSTAAKR